jgi:DNA-binding XRE family transcriptional regulator
MRQLRASRIAHGYTQRDLARLISCDRAVIAKMESGSLQGNIKVWERLADILGESIESLRDDDSVPAKERAVP